jgi:ketosteroid isomerase-like protein
LIEEGPVGALEKNDEASQTRAANRQTLDAFVAAIGDADFERLARICTPDIVVEFPYSDPPRRLDGFDAYREAALPALETFRFRLELVRVHEALDPDLLIAEYLSDGIATSTGKPYRNVYVGVFGFRARRLASLREYWNPAIAAEALTPD